jgi:hypothetical protein
MHVCVWLKTGSTFIAWLKRERKAPGLEESSRTSEATLFKLLSYDLLKITSL